ncbi:hypothetical protein ACLB2K_037330 [Fragaria x ananassa]
MAFERFASRDESYGAFLNYKAPPVVSERHTIIEDCSGMQFHYSSLMAAQTVIVNPAELYFYATKDEYQGSSWPKTTSIYPLPHPPRVGYYPQPREVPHQTAGKPTITSDEAARRSGGLVITEFRTKKQYRS